MKETTFEDCWIVISRIAQYRASQAKGVKLNDLATAKREINSLYDDCRKQMKLRMAKDETGVNWQDIVLDRHKIAAALCWAITRHPILDTSAAQSSNDRSVNEVVAFVAPMDVMVSMTIYEAEKAKNPTLAKYLGKGPALPVTNDGIPFHLHAARTLYWRRVSNLKAEADINKWLDPFPLAIIYYMIEFFTVGEAERNAR